MHPINLFLHLAGVVLWVGGMFFAWMCLRPVAAAQLQPPARLKLWAAVFARFIPWVWGSVAAILLSGMLTLLATGMAHAPLHWHLMLVLGVVMTSIFIYVLRVPYAKLKKAVADEGWTVGGEAIRRSRIEARESKVLWQSQPIPHDPFVYRGQLCVLFKEKATHL